MKNIANGSKVVVTNHLYATGITGTIVENRIFGNSNKQVVYYIELDSEYKVPYRDDTSNSVMLEYGEFKLTTGVPEKLNFDDIYEQAVIAAKNAEWDFICKHGEPMYCGFAWVDFPSARTPFVSWCKKNGVGRKHWKKGWTLWNITSNPTQSMDLKMAGAVAFANVLNSHGIDCNAGCRPD
jgi:hypothetical protein